MTIGERINKIRKQKGMTQKELAEKLGVSYVMISQYEHGIRKPKIKMIKNIAAALNVEYTELLCDDSEYNAESTTIGERIRMYRKEKRLTQKQLAEKANIAETSVVNYETERRAPSVETIKKIADALDIECMDLICDDNKHNTECSITLGKNIEEARKNKEMTQKQLAGAINRSTSVIQKYEAGTTEPPLSVVEKIALALDTTPHDLLYGNSENITYIDNFSLVHNFSVIYKILAELERAMDFTEFDMNRVSAEKLKISEK